MALKIKSLGSALSPAYYIATSAEYSNSNCVYWIYCEVSSKKEIQACDN